MTSPNPGAYNYGATSVSETAVVIANLESTGVGGVLVHNSGSNPIFLGDINVTASTGFPILASATQLVPTAGGIGVPLYAIASTGSNTVYVLFATGA